MATAVRDATLADVDALAEIHVAAWEAAFRGIVDDDSIDARTEAVRRRMWTEKLSNPDSRGAILVVEVDGVVRGFAYGAPGHYDDEDPERIINLNAVFIDPGFKGRGVAAAVHQGFLEACARLGYERVSGQIHPENEASLRFFIEKGGWHRDGFERVVEGRTEWRIQRPLDDIRANL